MVVYIIDGQCSALAFWGRPELPLVAHRYVSAMPMENNGQHAVVPQRLSRLVFRYFAEMP